MTDKGLAVRRVYESRDSSSDLSREAGINDIAVSLAPFRSVARKIRVTRIKIDPELLLLLGSPRLSNRGPSGFFYSSTRAGARLSRILD